MSGILSYPSIEDYREPAYRRHCLIFFVSGNPGLIDYYKPFLFTLRQLLDETEKREDVSIHIYGRDLAGFGDHDHEPFTVDRSPHDLEFQIQNIYKNLASLAVPNGSRKGAPFDEVILVGHSVGAYISLEIFHRHLHNSSPAPHLRLKSGILLFPTVSHIAQSPSGRWLNRLRATPFLDRNAHRIAKGFVSVWPSWALNWFMRTALGFSAHGAAVTTRFLTSRDGIWQAIHLGKDEIRVIGEERWAEELWEIADETAGHCSDVPKFFFYFGKDDHWVANEYRDAFIEKRNEHATRKGPKHKRGRTLIVIDEDKIPHAFCLSEYGSCAWID
jgi:pimeloyl-ACP methyl ester carboxylesterase